MKHFFKFFKGMIIGIGAILPGVSGAVIAVSFGVYKDLVIALDGVLKHPLKSIKSIWQYLIGIAVGVVISYFFISAIFKYAPLPITFLFLGLILGEIPQMIKEMKKVKLQYSHIVTALVASGTMIAVLFLPAVSHNFDGAIKYLIYALIGMLMALSFIVPGLSGTMLLMALGFYTIFLNVGNEARFAIQNGDLKTLFSFAPDILIIFLGLIIGALILVRPIHWALKKKPNHFNFAVLGIVLISPVNILLSLKKENEIDIKSDPNITNIFDAVWWIWVISGTLLVVGFIIAFLFLKKKETNEEDHEVIENEEDQRII